MSADEGTVPESGERSAAIMKRLSLSLAFVLLGLGTAVGAVVDGSSGGPAGKHGGAHSGLRRVETCLWALNLPADRQSAIDEILASGKTALRADTDLVKADHRKLETDLANGADKSVVGQDVITQTSDTAKRRSDMQSIRDQILSKLSPDERSRFTECDQAPAAGRGTSPPGADSS
jgi:hypothetical protein